MDGYPCHTFRWVNEKGESFFVKYKYKCAEIKNFSFQEAVNKCGEDPDFAKRELWQHINNGGTANWTWCVQIMPAAQAATYKWDPFDNTKVWDEADFPWIPIGNLTFDRNPENFHRDMEQAAFSPGRLVPGIEPSPDPLLQFRCWFYSDAQIHRLGTNYHQIPVNCPFRSTNYHPINRDGDLRTDTNGGAEPHYVPNSVPLPLGAKRKDPYYDWAPETISGVLNRMPSSKHEYKKGDDYIQAKAFYASLKLLDRQHLHRNIAQCLKLVSSGIIKTRFLVACYFTDPQFASGVLAEMGETSITIQDIEVQASKAPVVADSLTGYTPLVSAP